MSDAKVEGLQSWEIFGAKYKQSCFEKIPSEWRLPSQYLELSNSGNSTANVLRIPRECGLLTSEEIELTENNDATSLLESLRSGQVTSLAVTTALCKRAAIAQQLVSSTPSRNIFKHERRALS
jgi:amidase